MTDRYTEISSQGWISRIGGSIVGMLFGFLLIPISIIVLYWNEGRAVEAIRALDQGAKQTIEASLNSTDPKNDGKLVHVVGGLTTSAPARDPVFHVTGKDLIRLERKVEMYQWKEETSTQSHESVGGTKTTETTYSYKKVWSDQAIDSSEFKHGDHRNPSMPVHSAKFDSRDAKLGSYRLDPDVLAQLDTTTELHPDDDQAPNGFQKSDDGFYRGNDSASPAVGDLKVSFTAFPAQTISVVAGQSDGALTTFSEPNGYTIALAKPGSASAADLFSAKKAEEGTLTWILRFVGFALMFVAFLLIASPISTVLAVIPLFEWIAEAGAFLAAIALAVTLSLIVIAVAWIIHRPLTGIVLLAVAIGALVLFRRLHGSKSSGVAGVVRA